MFSDQTLVALWTPFMNHFRSHHMAFSLVQSKVSHGNNYFSRSGFLITVRFYMESKWTLILTMHVLVLERIPKGQRIKQNDTKGCWHSRFPYKTSQEQKICVSYFSKQHFHLLTVSKLFPCWSLNLSSESRWHNRHSMFEPLEVWTPDFLNQTLTSPY